LRGDSAWDLAFAEGLGRALSAFDVDLLGGDTVAVPDGTPQTLSLTAIGISAGPVPSRPGARPGDVLWVSGTIGDAHAGLRIAKGERDGDGQLLDRYRAPRPRIEAGQRLVSLVGAMMDVSDGLLIDAGRIAAASGVRVRIALDAVPMSEAYLAFAGTDRGARVSATTGGDDYELLFTTGPDGATAILTLGEELGLSFSRIGTIESGTGVMLFDGSVEVKLPPHLGYEH
jgi:thiamine-monophosphate kinase